MQPSQNSIALSAAPHNQLPPGRLASLDPALEPLVRQAFQHAIDAGATDVQAVVQGALLQLRNQMIRPWLPEHKTVRQSALWIISHPCEALALAESIVGQKGAAHG